MLGDDITKIQPKLVFTFASKGLKIIVLNNFSQFSCHLNPLGSSLEEPDVFFCVPGLKFNVSAIDALRCFDWNAILIYKLLLQKKNG
jgi:hypothetical protein